MKDNKSLILVGTILCVLVMLYMFAVTFWNIPVANVNTSHIIIGYMSGVITTIVGFWFGGSLKPVEKSEWENTSQSGINSSPASVTTTSASGDDDGTPDDPEIEYGDEPIGNQKVEEED